MKKTIFPLFCIFLAFQCFTSCTIDSDSSSEKNLSKKTINENTTVQKYFLFFSYNYKNAKTDFYELEEGTKINGYKTPSRDYYSFEGWYDDETNGNKITFPFTLDKTYKIYAHWKCTDESHKESEDDSEETSNLPDTLFEDFSSDSFNTNSWKTSGTSVSIGVDVALQRYLQYNTMFFDEHGKAAVLKIKSNTEYPANNPSISIDINPKKDSSLSFDYNMELFFNSDSTLFQVLVDDQVYAEYYFMEINGWKKDSIPVLKGKHTVTFRLSLPSTTFYLFSSETQKTNAVLIDNISLIPDEIEKIELSPMGKQESFIDGYGLNFTAKALRSDGSVKTDVKPVYTSKNGEISEKGTFTPKVEGESYVTANIGDFTVTNDQIYIHSREYFAEPVTTGGVTYTGYSGKTGLSCSSGTTFYSPTPLINENTKISADGFIPICGKVSNKTTGNINALEIIYDKDSKNKKYFILLKDDFDLRIWLRYGPGNYTIKHWDLTKFIAEGDDGYSQISTNNASIIWKVTNTNDSISPVSSGKDDFIYTLTPSNYAQSDEFPVTNIVNDILYKIGSDASDERKILACHDWITDNYLYDYDSITGSDNPDGYRKNQQAVTCINNRMAICTGYTSTFAAMLRYMNIPCKIVVGGGHTWNEVYLNNKWYMVDSTWDDTYYSNEYFNCSAYTFSDEILRKPGTRCYMYYFTSTTDSEHGESPEIDYTRNITPSTQNITAILMPEGLY